MTNKAIDLWKFIEVKGLNECWPWKRQLAKDSYPKWHLGGKPIKVCRILYEELHGSVDRGLVIMHLCNNRWCCNPDHFIEGTKGQNSEHALLSGSIIRDPNTGNYTSARQSKAPK